ncbi:hypothetical protein CMQ_4011 [Grosmannia clavigera kw1407]|uniref:RGS domain-containing protein n=1 Tax=Grosmannia clavigera (strain kw1407 / UAMH 11150) TaxID=655863 RepID=F0X873_GROCL|nr:uncharacterized protein CMQ_4011 [Grosmannia clavigera kw1407]EFX05942.1 hypothetical protein CMQ_4011 [Grosmannia clavigera kw1407]
MVTTMAMTKTKTTTTTTVPRPATAVASPTTRLASYGTAWPSALPLTAISFNSSRAPEPAKMSKALRKQRHQSLPSSLPLPLLSSESLESLKSAGTQLPSPSASVRTSRRRSATLLSQPAAPSMSKSRSAERTGHSRRELSRDNSVSISVHRLRSNSGLALHTNSAALRRYIDYNQDGSTRLPPTGEAQDDALLQSIGEGILNGSSRSKRDRIPPGAPDGPGLFSREMVFAVLQDPEARRRLWDFARSQNNEENLDFLEKVEEYNKAVHGVVALLADISTRFTGLAATCSLGLPQTLAKPLTADVMHLSRSILPGLEMLFGAAAAHIEERIIRDIYPAFIKHQLDLRMKASLGAPSARAAQAPFRFTGLGHAFCLTDPYRPDNPVVYASDSFAHIIGYPKAEDIPRSGRCLSSPKMRAQQAKGDEFTQDIVLNRRWWDKQPYWSHVSMCPLLSSRGHIRFSLVGLVDVSDVIKSKDGILDALKCDGPACLLPKKGVDGSEKAGNSLRRKKERPSSLILENPSNSNQSNSPQKSPKSATSSSTKSLFNPFSRMRRSPANIASPEDRSPTTDEIKNKPKSPEPVLGLSKARTPSPTGECADSSLPMYSRFMLLQFMPKSSRAHDKAAPPSIPKQSGRHNSSAQSSTVPPPAIPTDSSRFKIAFCSHSMLELLGLGDAGQDAVLYHDVFDVLLELAGSNSVTPLFRAAVQQRIAAAEPASLELSIPAGGAPAPGAVSAGLGAGLASPTGSPVDGEDSLTDSTSRRARLFSFSRSKKHSSERSVSNIAFERRGHDSSKTQKLMSHWTPLKDADGKTAWIALVISPLIPSRNGMIVSPTLRDVSAIHPVFFHTSRPQSVRRATFGQFGPGLLPVARFLISHFPRRLLERLSGGTLAVGDDASWAFSKRDHRSDQQPHHRLPPHRVSTIAAPRDVMTDANPILRSLLGSLTTIDQRLSFIETALRIPPAPRAGPKLPAVSSSVSVSVSGRDPDWSAAGQVAGRRPLPTSAPSFSSLSLSSSSSSSAASPPSSTPKQQATQALLSTSFNRLKRPSRSRLQNRRVAKYGGGSDEEAAGQRDLAKKEEEPGKRIDMDGAHEGDSLQCVVVAAAADVVSDGALLPRELRPTEASHSRLEALPEGFLVTGRASLQDELDGWTIPRGYSMRINGTRSHGRRQKIRMVCFRGGRSRLRPKDEDRAVMAATTATTAARGPDDDMTNEHDNEADQVMSMIDGPAHGHGHAYALPSTSRRRQRKPTTDRISKKCECPFRFELVEIGPGADRYAVHYTNDDHRRHNHAAADLMLDPRARKLPAALKDEVDQWLRGPGGNASASASADGSDGLDGPWSIARIQAELQRRGYGHVLDFDLRNRKRALLHKERLAQLKTEGAASSDSNASSSPTAVAAVVAGNTAENSL